jgi:decaprenylphospho-beta-D-ribofuranose 2-oxidase
LSVKGGRLASVEAELVSFDGGTRCRQRLVRPDRYRHLELLGDKEVRSVRGGGYSYAAASFGAGATVQDTRAFDRILAFDEEQGLLECEGGATLGKVFRVAAARGFYLPVQAGYPRITVGGCIAADAHGKNQFRDGNFSRQVESLRVFHPRRGVVDADRERNGELFDLTCGGLGLSGHVLSARLRLARLPGRSVLVRRTRIARLEDTPAMLEAEGARATFLYTWHNLTLAGDALGRGFLYAGQFLDDTGPPWHTPASRVVVIDASNRGRLQLALLGRGTTAAFNLAYEAQQALAPAERTVGLFDLLFPVARRVLYFRLFGRKGFHEAQIIVPREAFSDAARALQRRLGAEPLPVTLASCKLFRGTPKFLRFDGSGVCLAVDFPRGCAGDRFAAWLDGLVRDVGGRPNIIKDSRLGADTVRACYPAYDDFRERLHQLDPDRLYRSEVSQRLAL